MPRLVVDRREWEGTVVTVPPSTEPTRIIVKLGEIKKHTSARVVFEAPENVEIWREEIQKIKDKAARAAK